MSDSAKRKKMSNEEKEDREESLVDEDGRSVAVVVIGEIGRNPRMQYHALELSRKKTFSRGVDLFGYEGPQPCEQVRNSKRIRIHHLPKNGIATKPIRPGVSRLVFLFLAFLKLFFQSWQLFWSLMSSDYPKPEFILVQTPPAMPTLAVVWLVCRLRGSKFVIDWHNFAFSLVRISRGEGRIVSLSRFYERFFGRRGDIHFCVTHAMAEFLKKEWGITATVLHDKPQDFFHRATLQETHDLFKRLSPELGFSYSTTQEPTETEEEETIVTKKLKSGEIVRKEDRPAIVISSTSWTADEDFSIFLEALRILECELSCPTRLLCLITGKGPLRSHYEREIAQASWLSREKNQVKTLWLASEDYPLLLGSSDLGVSLHFSSSGLDLPMKVVDMFGCKLPVCAIGFDCLKELVEHEKNGMVFKNSRELADQLHELLKGFPKSIEKLERLRSNIRMNSWKDEWSRNALPVLI